jgi:hypothetical protein
MAGCSGLGGQSWGTAPLNLQLTGRAFVIYTVELNFSDTAREDAWNAWYETYLAQLVSLPGLFTAQRFRAVDPSVQRWDYLALYSVASLDVFDSEAYRRIGGGGNASIRFKPAIRRRRNVYTGVERVPEVTNAGRVLLCEDAPHGFDLPDCLFLPLAAAAWRQAGATELDGEPSRRALAIIDAAAVERLNLTLTDGLAVYAPITNRYVQAVGDAAL